MADPVKQVQELEAALEKAKMTHAKMEGEKSAAMKELKEVYDVNTYEEGLELLEDYKAEETRLEELLKAEIQTAKDLLGL